MPLPVVPLPADDEWLGYWLARVGREYCMSIGQLLRALELHPAETSRPSWVHILDWTEEQWSHLAAQLHTDAGKLRAMQFVTIEPGWAADYVCCPECFLEMRIAESGLPYWRRRWMDATATWCQTHGAPLVPIARLSSLAHRSLDSPETLFQAITEAHQEKSAAWIERLAEDADELTRLLPTAPGLIVGNKPGQLHSSHGGALFLALLDQILLLVLEIVAAEYDDAMLLATYLDITSPESMGMHRLPRRIHCLRSPVLGQIRDLKQRTWLLGIAACIIAPIAATPDFKARTMEQREMLRGWLWDRVDPWQLAKLVPMVIKASSAGLMLSWPAAQSWTSPTTAAGWFQRSAGPG